MKADMTHCSSDKMIKSDTKRAVCASCVLIVLLGGVMMFSPLASQFEDGVTRGSAGGWEIDSLMEAGKYKEALDLVDSEIGEKNRELPRFAYFDRFKSEQQRYDASVTRYEIYYLQWKRIEILEADNDVAALEVALEDYCKVIGYNRERAMELLARIKDR